MGSEGCKRPGWVEGSCFRPASNVVYEVDRGQLPPSTRKLAEEQGAYFGLERDSLQERVDRERRERNGN